MDILAARKKAAERAKTKAAITTHPEQPAHPGPITPTAHVDEPAAPAAATASEMPLPSQDLPSVDAAVAPEREGEAAEENALPRTQELELLAFRLGNEEYCVMVDQVREVLKMREITPVPRTADYVLGVTSIRGKVLPVIDLCKRLGLASGVRDEKSRIVVISVEDEDMGILVDRMTGVVRFLPDIIRPAPDTIDQRAGAEFLRGIARKDDKLYILLDVDKAVGR